MAVGTAERMTWSALLRYVMEAEACGEPEARHQIQEAIDNRVLRYRWEHARAPSGGTGSATLPIGPVYFHTADYWQTCAVDPTDPDRVLEPPAYDPKMVDARTAKRLEKARQYRKPLFDSDCVMKIWPVPPSNIANSAGRNSTTTRFDDAFLTSPAASGRGEDAVSKKGELERYPGRPSIRSAVLKMWRERAAATLDHDTLAAEAEWLYEWAGKTFDGERGVPSTPKVVENQIRDEYRKVHPLKPSKTPH